MYFYVFNLICSLCLIIPTRTQNEVYLDFETTNVCTTIAIPAETLELGKTIFKKLNPFLDRESDKEKKEKSAEEDAEVYLKVFRKHLLPSIDEFKQKLDTLTTKIDDLSKNIPEKEVITKIRQDVDEIKRLISTESKTVRTRTEDVKKQLEKIQENMVEKTHLKELKEEIQQVKTSIVPSESLIPEIKEQIKKIEQTLPTKLVSEELKTEIAKINERNTECNQDLNDLKRLILAENEKDSVRTDDLVKQLEKLQDHIVKQTYIKDLKDEIQEVKTSIVPSQSLISEIKEKIKKIEQTLPTQVISEGLKTEIAKISECNPPKIVWNQMKNDIESISKIIKQTDIKEIKDGINKLEEELPSKEEVSSITTQVEELSKYIKANVKDIASSNKNIENYNVKGDNVDCFDLLKKGYKSTGVYRIKPNGYSATHVLCDMKTDGGGWTVILSRQKQKNSINFTRGWTDYKNGFGKADEEYWLGNEALYRLTNSRIYSLRMELKESEGDTLWAAWSTFKVSTGSRNYKLEVKKYSLKSTAQDTMVYHNNKEFSTYDQDNDNSDRNCAKMSGGGWWYDDCYISNPTGRHNPNGLFDSTAFYSAYGGILFVSNADWIQFKIRPR